MEKLRNFLTRRNKSKKFGEGKRLTDSTQPRVDDRQQQGAQNTTPRRAGPSAAAQRRCEAAQARMTEKPETVNWSKRHIQALAKKKMESSAVSNETFGSPVPDRLSDPPRSYAVPDVYFRVPIIDDEVGTFLECQTKICDYLYEFMKEDPVTASSLMIYSCNHDKNKKEACVGTILRCLENIRDNPENDKYFKIRKENKTFKDCLLPMLGAIEFLKAAGFVEDIVPRGDGQQPDDVLIFKKDPCDLVAFETLISVLIKGERIECELDRSLKLLLPQQAHKQKDLPDAFFNLTLDEVKRQQKEKTEVVERNKMLLTQDLRKKLESGGTKNYKYTLIRIRFNSEITLQATFRVNETLNTVLDVLRENLEDTERTFYLVNTMSRLEVSEYTKTLSQLGLVPSSVLIFNWDKPQPDDGVCLNQAALRMLDEQDV